MQPESIKKINSILDEIDSEFENLRDQDNEEVFKKVIIHTKHFYDEVEATEYLALTIPTVKAVSSLLFSLMRNEVELDDVKKQLLLKTFNVFRVAVVKLQDPKNKDVIEKLLFGIQKAIRATVAKPITKKLFLKDPDHYFDALEKFIHALAVEQEFFLENEKTLNELFRIIHTIKGNSDAFGFEVISNQSHLVEDVLQKILRSESPKNISVAHYLARACEGILSSFKAERQKEFKEEKSGGVHYKYFLPAEINKKPVMIPCEAIAEVMRTPEIFTVPGSPQKWRGIIQSGSGFVPVVRANDRAEDSPYVVVVNFKGDQEVGKFSIPVSKLGEVKQVSLDDVRNIDNILKISEYAGKLGAA